jgi:tetratricopeptide (TPR) repeat protein
MSQELIIPLKLQEAIKNNNLVFFVGAGFSMPLGFPSWQKLIEDILLELIEKYGDTSDTNFQNILNGVQSGTKSLFEALNKIENDNDHGPIYKKKAKEIVNARIEKSSKNFSDNSPSHSILWEISKKIITTNYDKALEKYKPESENLKIFDNTNAFQILKSQLTEAEFLYKIHGDNENPESIILFESDYKEIYGKDNFNNDSLGTYFKDKTLLFIGFSLTDPFVTNLFSKIKTIYKGYTVNEHFVFTTKNEDFTEYDVTTIRLENWEKSLLEYLKKLQEIKSNSCKLNNNLPTLIEYSISDKLTDNDIASIVKLIETKTKELSNNPGDKELHKEVNDLRGKINKLMFGEVDYSQEVDKPFRNADLQSLFDVIYSSEKLDKLTLERIQNVRTKTDIYKWYDRSVIVSAIACSLIHHNKADEQKITLLIDFINDNEDKVWQKAITTLFMILNHLGNKWLRFPSIITKIKSLNQNLRIQNACSAIIQLFAVGLNNVSMIGEDLFNNPYFRENAFNYFLPYHQEENPAFELVYDTYTGGNIEDYITALNRIPIPDQLKYLLCSQIRGDENDEEKNKDISKKLNNILNLNAFFYPYSIYVQEIISFYKYFPLYKHEEKLKSHLKLTETPLKDYLLNAKQKYSALGSHFMKEKNWSQAIVNFKEAIKLDSNEVSYLLNLANCYKYKNEKNEEFEIRVQIKKMDNNNILNLEKLFELYFNEKKDFNKSMEIADELIKIEPKEAIHYYSMGCSYSELHNYEKALEFFDIAISIDSKNDKYYSERANIYYKKNELEKSNQELDIAISLNNKEKDYFLDRATNFMLLSSYEKALEDIKVVESFGENDEFVFNAYANYYRLTNSFDKAFENVEKAKKIKNIFNFTGTTAVIYASMGDDDNFYKFLEMAFNEGADVNLLYNDVKIKYKNEPKFIDLLKKYNQKLYC